MSFASPKPRDPAERGVAVDESRCPWRNTTHDWASVVDLDHLARIRRNPATFAPGGVRHLILEVIAYAADEAEGTTGDDVLPFSIPMAQCRGISVVAALSEWLVHTNRHRDGAWVQRYEHGVPVTDLVPVAGDGKTGTTVWFLPDETLRRPSSNQMSLPTSIK